MKCITSLIFLLTLGLHSEIVGRIGQNEFFIIYRLYQDKNVVYIFVSLFFRDNEHGLEIDNDEIV